MTSVQSARGIVADAEKALRDLMQQEIQGHRYSELAELARLADGVSRLLRGLDSAPPRKGAPAAAQHRAKTKAASRTTAPGKGYPRFERDASKLIKVGWSKRSREEYEHRTPRDAVASFLSYLGSRVDAGATFVMEDLLPVPDAAGGEIPEYQVYMTLAWLRDVGAVEKKGRDGYVLREARLTDAYFNELWDRVALRS